MNSDTAFADMGGQRADPPSAATHTRFIDFLRRSGYYKEAMERWGSESNAVDWYVEYRRWALSLREGEKIPTAALCPLRRAVVEYASRR